MKPYKCVPVFNYCGLCGIHGVTRVAVQGSNVYLGTTAGVLLVVNISPSFLLEDLIHSGICAKAVTVFSPSTGAAASESEWRVDAPPAQMSAATDVDSRQGAILDIAIGPSLGLEEDELLCLSAGGCVVLLKTDFESPPIVVAEGAVSFAQRSFWDHELGLQQSSQPANASGSLNAGSSWISDATLCVSKKNKLTFFKRSNEKNGSKLFVPQQEIPFSDTALQLLWVDQTVGLVLPDEYRIYTLREQSEASSSPLLPEATSGLPTGSSSSIKMVLTNTQEVLVLGHGTLGIFVNLLTSQLSSKSTIPWKSPVTALESAGPFIVGATIDDELLVFTSQTPITLCQTLPTQGPVVDMAVCRTKLGHYYSDSIVSGCPGVYAKPVAVATTDALWFLTPIPFLSRFKQLVLEFNLSEALHLIAVHTPSQSALRPTEMGEFYEVFGWRYFQQLNLRMAFLYFRLTLHLPNTVARLLEYWSSSIGLPEESVDAAALPHIIPLWRRILYRWLRPLLRQHGCYAISPIAPIDETRAGKLSITSLTAVVDEILAPSESLIETMFLAQSEEKRTEAKEAGPSSQSDADEGSQQKLNEAHWLLIDFLLTLRPTLLKALLTQQLETQFPLVADPSLITANAVAPVSYTAALQRVWNEHVNELLLPALINNGAVDDLRTLQQLEAGFFVRLVDATLLSVAQQAHRPLMTKKQMDLERRVQNLLFPSFCPDNIWTSTTSFDDATYLCTRNRNIRDLANRWAASLPCVRSWIVSSAPTDPHNIDTTDFPTLCAVDDCQTPNVLKEQRLLWLPLLHCRQLQFKEALDAWISSQTLPIISDSFYRNVLPAAAAATAHAMCSDVPFGAMLAANMVCSCTICRSRLETEDEREKKAQLFREYISSVFPLLRTLEHRVAFLVLVSLGCRVPSAHRTVVESVRPESSSTKHPSVESATVVHFSAGQRAGSPRPGDTSCSMIQLDPARFCCVTGVHMIPESTQPLLPYEDAVALLASCAVGDEFSSSAENEDGPERQSSHNRDAKLAYLQIVWTAHDDAIPQLPCPLVTELLIDGLRYLHSSSAAAEKSDSSSNHDSTLVVSKLFLLQVLELDPNVDASIVLRHINDLEHRNDSVWNAGSTRKTRFRAEKSMCYARLGHYENALDVLLDPSDSTSLGICEAFCHAVNGGIFERYSKKLSLSSLRGPDWCRVKATQLFTAVFDGAPTRVPSLWRIQAEFWDISPSFLDDMEPRIPPQNSTPIGSVLLGEQVAKFDGYDVLLDLHLEQSKTDAAVSEQDDSTNGLFYKPSGQHKMLYVLLKVLIGRWKQAYDGIHKAAPEEECHSAVPDNETLVKVTHEADHTCQYFEHLYKCCALTLLHKYARHPDFDVVEVLQLIPDSWSLEALAPFLLHSLRHLATVEHRETLRESLARSSYLQCSCAWAAATSKAITVTRESTCPVCSKRLALPSVASSFGPSSTSSAPGFPLLAYDPKTGRCGHLQCVQTSNA